MELRNKKWTEEEFLEERKHVLATWKTGSDPELDLDIRSCKQPVYSFLVGVE